MSEDRSTTTTGRSRVSRRWFVGGGALLAVLGGGSGALLRFVRDPGPVRRPAHLPPAALDAAITRELALLADLDATTGGSTGVRATVRRMRADHAEHLTVLRQLLATYDPAPTSAGPTSTGRTAGATAGATAPAGVPRTVPQLRGAEQAAAAAYASAAITAPAELAVLLASMSACEASHAAVLT